MPEIRYIRKDYAQEDDPERPIPYIVDLNEDGVLKIGWSKVMSPTVNHTEISPTFIALEEGFELEDYRFWETQGRELRSYENFEVVRKEPRLEYFADEVARTYELMQLVDALELLITPDDPSSSKPVEFTWTVTSYNKDFIWIKLNYLNPWDISDD